MAGRLFLEPHRIEGGTVEVAGVLEYGAERFRLWWKLPAEWRGMVTEWTDPFVIGFLFLMMERGEEVRVEGKVSPSLLENVETFMRIWGSWVSGKYRMVRVGGTEEIEAPAAASDAVVMPFSAGIDSCFTLWRHGRGLAGRRTRKIGAGLVMNGFDVVAGRANAALMYKELLRRAETMLRSMGAACIPMSSNFRELPTYWEHSHSTQLVSGASLLGKGFSGMLLANSVTYRELEILWGSHPLSDPCLSSTSFPVVDDGGECGRVDKCAVIAAWPEAMEHVQVCFRVAGNVENCCVCEKCIRSILSFRIIGVERPKAFARDVTDDLIRKVRLNHDLMLKFWLGLEESLEKYKTADASWVREIHAAVRRAKRRRRLAAMKAPFLPVRNGIRRIFRGSAFSRKELQRHAEERNP